MADKFPEIDVDTSGQDIEGDFFSREKELVGDEFRTEEDNAIAEREKANAKKKAEIIASAQQSIDDFYDNHNNKKEEHAKQVLKEQEEFLEKRDGFLTRGTLWDRVNELVKEAGEGSDSARTRAVTSLVSRVC
ncbi:hypothetical protein HF325_003746 [Metschnikowia pulcherrima]|uniref:Clathrin light chain n=1 Tax=Metschnikowia pulcherrima TaxID=27326 RepID=A0A8H7LB99_9ASCO|nr:hypothetical protein HF325_003746 [Metschnikowia pulcherrima]